MVTLNLGLCVTISRRARFISLSFPAWRRESTTLLAVHPASIVSQQKFEHPRVLFLPL